MKIKDSVVLITGANRGLGLAYARAALAAGAKKVYAAALFPRPWLMLFGSDPAMLEAGTQYLRAVGPFYGFFGVGLVLYFASQGAGRLLWPVLGNIARLAVAGIGGWLALRWGGQLSHVFVAQGAALVVYGIVIASTIAGGAWFGRVGWPRTPTGLLRRVAQA